MKLPLIYLTPVVLLIPILMMFGQAQVEIESRCFFSTNGIDGHCHNKKWGSGKDDEDTPAGCRCISKKVANQTHQDECDCKCTGKGTRCVMRYDHDRKNHSSIGEKIFFCMCDHANKWTEMKEIKDLGKCMKTNSATVAKVTSELVLCSIVIYSLRFLMVI